MDKEFIYAGAFGAMTNILRELDAAEKYLKESYEVALREETVPDVIYELQDFRYQVATLSTTIESLRQKAQRLKKDAKKGRKRFFRLG